MKNMRHNLCINDITTSKGCIVRLFLYWCMGGEKKAEVMGQTFQLLSETWAEHLKKASTKCLPAR